MSALNCKWSTLTLKVLRMRELIGGWLRRKEGEDCKEEEEEGI